MILASSAEEVLPFWNLESEMRYSLLRTPYLVSSPSHGHAPTQA